MPSRATAPYDSSITALLVAIASTSLACAGPTAGTPSKPAEKGSVTSGVDACTSKPDEARARLTRVIEANASCSTDADCVTVGFSSSCFDSCMRAMAASGQAAYEAALGEANAKECAEYVDAGCPAPVHPPCEPPSPATCTEGVCR